MFSLTEIQSLVKHKRKGKREMHEDLFDEMETIANLLVEFDEMGFAPTALCPNAEEYAINWKNKLINAIQGICKKLENQ